VLAAGVRWHYIGRNLAIEAGPNPQPRGEEVWPFTREELDAVALELTPRDAAIVIFGAETGLRTNEWTASERRDVDRINPAVAVARRFAEGKLTPYPKTQRRRVPLTRRAVEGLELVPPRIDTPILFPGRQGRAPKPQQLAQPRLVPGARRRRRRQARTLRAAAHVRPRGARAGRVDLPALTADGRACRDHRGSLWALGAGLRGLIACATLRA